MKKIFKFLAYTFVSSIIIFGAVLVVYRQNIFEYLNSINNLSRTAETMIDNIKPGDELGPAPTFEVGNSNPFKAF
jgi:hypothetical protein